jgi:S-layer homology domain.
MRIKSKLICVSVTAAMLLTMTISSFAASNPFSDLKDVATKDKILFLQEKGIVKGIGNNRFAPDTQITAAQGVQLIVNAFDLNLDTVRFAKEPKATDYFTKADNNAWYAQGLITAAVNNMPLPADLDPQQKWTKEEFTNQLIQTMENHYNLPAIKLVHQDIADQDEMTPEYDGSIQRALLYGVVKLDGDGNFNPKSEITRAQAAEEIYNALEYIDAHTGNQTQG